MTIRIFRHYVNLRFLLLGIAEWAIFVATLYVSSYVRFSGEVAVISDVVGPLAPRAVVFASIMVIAMLSSGMYQSRPTYSVIDFVLRFAVSLLMGSVVLALVFYVFPGLFTGRGVLALATALSFVSIGALRGIFFNLIDQDALKRRILVLGSGAKAMELEELEKAQGHRAFKIVGFVRTGEEASKTSTGRVFVLSEDSLAVVARRANAEEIVVAMDDRRKGFPLDALLECKAQGIQVSDLLTFFERETGAVPLNLLYPSWLVYSDGWKRGHLQRVLQRTLDVLASVAFLSITWPVMVVAVLAIWLESGGRGPVLYRQTRVGLNGETFEVLKFRSMVVGAEPDGKARWATPDDDRITRVGKIIRRTRIDELPQLFNVLAGDMSFVGPRPERPEFVLELSKKIPYYCERHRVKPGITGWAQLRYRYAASEDDAAEKLQYDLYYIKNHSLFLDALILLQTAEVVIWCRGAR